MNRRRYQHDGLKTRGLPINLGTESPEFTVIVKHIPATTNRYAIIDFANQFGTLAMEPHITQTNNRLQKIALLTYTKHEAVERCMSERRQTLVIDGYPVNIQRFLANGRTFGRSYRLLLFLEGELSNRMIEEDEIRSYFDQNYGRTQAFEWTSDNVAQLDFEDYDSVDRSVAKSLTHTINGVQVRLEKVRSSLIRSAYEQILVSNELKFCVHVGNIPPDVSGEQLATVFDSRVWNVLIRKGANPNRDLGEAWILNIPTMADAEQLVASFQSDYGMEMQCEAGKEPLNEWTLCSGNRDGCCKYDKSCIYRHITCTAGDQCANEECPFSHSTRRPITPNPRHRPPGPVSQQYRIKIDGLPLTMTALQLLSELKNQPLNMINSIESPEMPPRATVRHFYLVRQAAEKLARKRVFAWHDYPIRQNYIVKCQLEYDRVPVEKLFWDLPRPSLTVPSANDLWLRAKFAPLSPGEARISGMPRDPAVLSVYHSNILVGTREVTTSMWILTAMTSDLTLESFVGQHRSAITFQDALILARQLLDILARCHSAHIFHRNLHPSHILVQRNHDHMLVKEIRLVLISFGLAWIDGQQLGASETDDRAIFEQVMQRQSTESQSFLFDNQRCSAILDSTGICRILFWLLTDHWLVDADSSSTVHRDKLGNTHIHPRIESLFDRAFGPFNDRWTIDQLGKELEAIDIEAAQLDALFPTSPVTSFSTPTDPIARAISLLAEVKQQFSQKYSACLKWAKEKSMWHIRANENEVRNTDKLIYDYQGKHCQLMIECSASINAGQITLTVNGSSLGEATRDLDNALKKLVQNKLK